jgi:hypothetical protein
MTRAPSWSTWPEAPLLEPRVSRKLFAEANTWPSGAGVHAPRRTGWTPMGADLGRSKSAGVIDGRPSPPPLWDPLWGRAREGGGFGLDAIRGKRCFRGYPPPRPTPPRGPQGGREFTAPPVHQSKPEIHRAAHLSAYGRDARGPRGASSARQPFAAALNAHRY